MVKIQTERDFCLVLAGLLAGGNLSSALAGEALVWWKNAAGPREGRAAAIGELLGRVAGRELEGEEGATQLRAAIAERLEALDPEALVGVIREKVAAYSARLVERAPVLESDMRDLDRMLRLMQLRAYLMLETMKPAEFIERQLERMNREDDVAMAFDGHRQELAQAIAWRDRAYSERNTLACLAARCIIETGGRAGWWRDGDGEPGFQCVVAFDLPQGQVSFHMDERDTLRPWETLPRYTDPEDEEAPANPWDGHTDAAKWMRVRDFLDTAIGELRAFAAKDQICAAGFPLTDPSHPPSDIYCAHYPMPPHIRAEMDETRKRLGLDSEGSEIADAVHDKLFAGDAGDAGEHAPKRVDVLESSPTSTTIRAVFPAPSSKPEKPPKARKK